MNFGSRNQLIFSSALSTWPKATIAFWPPKPKLKFRAYFRSGDRSACAIMRKSKAGVFRPMQGGKRRSRNARRQKAASIMPVAPKVWPVAPLVPLIAVWLENKLAIRSASRASFSGVAVPWTLIYPTSAALICDRARQSLMAIAALWLSGLGLVGWYASLVTPHPKTCP